MRHYASKYNCKQKKNREIFNRDFKERTESRHIDHFASNSEYKASIVKRFNRTLKTKLFTFMTAKGLSN